MLGSTPLTAILGSGVDNTDHDAVRAFIKTACGAGLSLLLIAPGSKIPFDGRTPKQRVADDLAAQEAARQAGRRDWTRVKSASGLALASTDARKVLRYLDVYIDRFGQQCPVNLAVEVGGSRLIVVDCDTEAQRRGFLDAAEAPVDLPPTVISPGTQDDAGHWVHTPGNGHYWFTLPEGVELPDSVGAMTWGGEDGFAVLWNRRYVLIPPSTRKEGGYELLGQDYEAPPWLIEAIVKQAAAKAARVEANRARDEDLASEIDTWAETVSWADILEPLGWTSVPRPDNCGCEVWTAPGNHASPKSATAHDSGCSLGRYTETNAPLHIWTDHDIEPFDSYVELHSSKTLSKLQAVAWAHYDGQVGKAMDEMGLGGSPMVQLASEDGLSRENLREEIPPLPTTPTQPTAEQPESPFDTDDEVEPRVFDCGIPGVPVIAPFSHWATMPPPEFCIEGLLERGGLSVMIGPPGAGKSTVALDLACHMATGKPWQGRRVIKTKVMYLPGEGLSGVVARINAWCHMHEVSVSEISETLLLGSPIIYISAGADKWAALMTQINHEGVGQVVFDTFARMAAEIDENSSRDVGLAVRRFDKLRTETNAGVMVLHHTAKHNPTAARGSSALMAALETELLVSEASWTFDELGLVGDGGRVPAGKPIQMWTSKQKNAEQLDHPIPLLMRNCDDWKAPYITDPSGTTEPRLGQIALAVPVEEPTLETAVRIAEFSEQFTEQGITRSEAVIGVRPDSFTAARKDASKAWKQKVSLAVDLALRLGLLQTVNGQRTGTRYERGPVDADTARMAHATAVMTDGID